MTKARTSPETENLCRQERVSMAKEICSHRGENPNSVVRGGYEGWEKYEPLAGACIREAERLFALRRTGLAQTPDQPAAWRTMNDHGHWHYTDNPVLANTWIKAEKLDVQPLYLGSPDTSTLQTKFDGPLSKD